MQDDYKLVSGIGIGKAMSCLKPQKEDREFCPLRVEGKAADGKLQVGRFTFQPGLQK